MGLGLCYVHPSRSVLSSLSAAVAIRAIAPIRPIGLIRPIAPTTPIPLSPYNEHRLAPIEGLGDAVLSFRTAVLLLLWNEVPASGEGVCIVLLDEDVALWV